MCGNAGVDAGVDAVAVAVAVAAEVADATFTYTSVRFAIDTTTCTFRTTTIIVVFVQAWWIVIVIIATIHPLPLEDAAISVLTLNTSSALYFVVNIFHTGDMLQAWIRRFLNPHEAFGT